jgi:hypothetical protein
MVDYAGSDASGSSADKWEHPANAADSGSSMANLQDPRRTAVNQGQATSFNWLDKFKQAAFGRPQATTPPTRGVMEALQPRTGRSAAGVGRNATAVAGAAGAFLTGPGQVVLIPYNNREALVRWEIAPEAQQNFHDQGSNQLVLRLFDVTDQDPDTDTLPRFQQFDLDDTSQEQRIMIPQQDRTYLAALGYLTRVGEFLEVARSGSVQVPTV